jgi:hypothetical protein
MASNTPESKFAADLKEATRVSPAVAAFVEILIDPALSQMERLNRVAIIAYRFGGLNERRSAELMRVWMTHDPIACHRFFVGEDRLRVERKIRELQTRNEQYVQTVSMLNAKVADLKKKLNQADEIQSSASQGDGGALDERSTRAKTGDFAPKLERTEDYGDRSESNV